MGLVLYSPDVNTPLNQLCARTHHAEPMELLGTTAGRGDDKRLGVQVTMKDTAGRAWVIEMDLEVLDAIASTCGGVAVAIASQPDNRLVANIAAGIRWMSRTELDRLEAEGRELIDQWRRKRATEGLAGAAGEGTDREVDAPLPFIERAKAIREATGRHPPGWRPAPRLHGKRLGGSIEVDVFAEPETILSLGASGS